MGTRVAVPVSVSAARLKTLIEASLGQTKLGKN